MKEKIRLADFHIACIKVGRVLHMTEAEVSSLLWENQKNVNRQSIDEDIVACCLLELMSHEKEYVNSVTGLLCDLSRIAYQNGIVSSTLPKTPNHLSKRLSKIKSNLQSEYNITYHIANVGAFKEITIRNNEKVCVPKTPNHLSKRLSKIKSNLQSEYNITYHIANVGAFKEITIRNNEKVCDSCESENHQ